jgi:hypothetical protein
MLAGAQITTAEQLAKAIDQQAKMPMVRIGEALVGLGFITEAQLADALKLQSSDRRLPLGELLVSRGDVTRADLQTALSRKMGYPIVDVAAFPVENEAALRLPLAAARRLTALPLMMRASRLVVALEDPSARVAIDEIEFSAQCKVLPVLARAGTLARGHRPRLHAPGQGRASSHRPTWPHRSASTWTAATTPTSCWPAWSRNSRPPHATTRLPSSRATTRWCG